MASGIYERAEYHKLRLSEGQNNRYSKMIKEKKLQLAEITRRVIQKQWNNLTKEERLQRMLPAIRASQTLEANHKISKSLKRLWSKKNKKERLEFMLPAILASQNVRLSSIEKMIWKVLDNLNIDYDIQVSFNHGKFIVDIYIPIKKLIIECNGDYWHNYKIFPESKIRDEALENYAIRNNFKIIWLWEHDIRENPEQTLENGFKLINIKIRG